MLRILLTCLLILGMISLSKDLLAQEMDKDGKAADVLSVPPIDSVRKVHETYLALVKSSKDRYLKVLQALSLAEQKKGNLDGIEELKPEIDMLGESSAESKVEFKNTSAKKAQDMFCKEMDTLKGRYLTDLQRVQSEEVKAGKIDNAKMIKAYIESLQGQRDMALGSDKEGTGIKANDPSLKNFKIQIIPIPELSDKQKKSIGKHVDKIEATSYFDERYKPEFSCDGKENTDWALKGNKGSIEYNFKKNISVRSIIFASRTGSDSIIKGKVVINSKYENPFVNYSGGNALVVSWPQIKVNIKSIKIESQEGAANPGISEVYIMDK
ncbi:MAG TPA: hypothetical protein DCZ94_07605 [Lentisphaeria bacterium]|nr:MAG: hypothetical protein A2X48_14280 [Lentisphaerae bacterium GWF2_49_21]HBC86802.1 hypothetical protein [Lentisphaeria bacterium]